ncbi:MAG: YwaF family protein [Lachnospiraceae bacterium]|nr:YwaF family protein [Lachnospiraceae bacterium]
MSKPHISDQCYRYILLGCGLLLVAMELYKQIFLFNIISHGHYNWWYFPFQLCSIPMYLCIIIPFVHSKKYTLILCTFLQNFSILGGVMALLFHSGLIYSYLRLTIHGFVWHILLILIGLLTCITQHSDSSIKGYLCTLYPYAFSCIIATVINIISPKAGGADMFYISPYHPSTQFGFHYIAVTYGTLAGILIYIIATCIGSLFVHLLCSLIATHILKSTSDF